MTETFITADTHFWHANIIQFCDRPYKNAYEMTSGMVERWNSAVGKNDVVWHLGDVSMGSKRRVAEVLWALNGRIHLIAGNHDGIILKNENLRQRFETIEPMRTLSYKNRSAELCHFPFDVWNKAHHNRAHFHGHSHGSLKTRRANRLDVGADCWDLTPQPLHKMFAAARAMTRHEPVDHHGVKGHVEATESYRARHKALVDERNKQISNND